EQKQRLFNSFEQAESSITRRYGGTGLGLTICKRLVEVMGGDIELQSTPDVGSCFSFTLQLGALSDRDSVVPAADSKDRITDMSMLDGRRLLVAEDNPINQQLALEYLGRSGARVDIAEDGRKAVDKATQHDYDAILMDIHMPNMDGLEATTVLREQGITTPIIAVSADALAERQAAAKAAGCNGYLTKPIDFDALLLKLAEIWPETSTDASTRGAANADTGSANATNASNAPTAPAKPGAAASEIDIDALRQQRLPGIDVAAAIKGHNDNVKLMLKLMGDFGNYYGDAGRRIRDHIAASELEDAERLAHNLHGVAGSFGAPRLKEASKALELALLAQQQAGTEDPDELTGLAQSFEVALTEVLESAEQLAREAAKPE
ncbi:MAG: response regulator, partial [Pseudomonadales bacterium]